MPRRPKPIAYPAPIRRTKPLTKAVVGEAFAAAPKFKPREAERPACGWFGWWYSANCPECST